MPKTTAIRSTAPRMRRGARARKPVLVVAAWQPELSRMRLILGEEPALRTRVATRAVGVGLVEGAIGTVRAIEEHRPAVVVLIGTAGLYPTKRDDLAMGKAAIVSRAHLLSLGTVEEKSYFPSQMPTRIDTDEEHRRELATAAGLPLAEVACPLGITRNERTAAKVLKVTGAELENLEVFSIGRAVASAALPFVAVVGISNRTGPRAHSQWKRLGEKAANAACGAVATWLREFLD